MNAEDKIAFGKNIRKYRKQKGMSQEALSEGICHTSTISQMERGIFTASGEILQKVCERLGISTSDLLEGHKEKLEADTVLEMIQIHIQREEYDDASLLVEGLNERGELAIYQKNQLVICEAECLLRTGKASKAMDLLKPLQSSLEQESEPDKKLLAKVYNQLGTSRYLVSEMVEAFSYYKQAYQVSLQFLEFDMLSAEICYNLGNTCRRLGKHALSLTYVTKAREFFAKTSSTKKLAHTLFSLGITYKELGDLEKAAEHLLQSRHLYEMENLLQLAKEVRYYYAYLVLAERNASQAIEQLLMQEDDDQLEEGNNPSRVLTYALTASVFTEKNDFENAKLYFEKALELFTETMAEFEIKYTAVYYFYSRYLLKSGDIHEAIRFAFKASAIFDKMGLARDSSESLVIVKRAYEKMGDYRRSSEVSDQIITKLQMVLGKDTFIERG